MLASRASTHFHKLLAVPNRKSTLQFLCFSTSLPEPSFKLSKSLVYFNTQITRNGRDGNIEAAESIFRSLPNKNVVTWTAMLSAYAQNGQLINARKVFDEMPYRNIASWNAMITAYTKNKMNVNDAHELFFRMAERNAVSYATMITGFVNAGRIDEAARLFSETPVKWRDPVCSNVMIKGYLKMGRLGEAVQVFEGMIEKDVVSWSSIIDGYCRNGMVCEARELFDTMRERNAVTWSSMINGYVKIGCFEEAFGLFLCMRRDGIVDVEATIATIIFEVCGKCERYTEGCQVHGLVLRLGLQFDVFLGNSIITMYSRFGCVGSAKNVFDLMSRKDVVSWNSLIACYVQTDKLDEAFNVFKRSPEKDVVSWTAMIMGFANKGLTGKCIELFEMIPKKDDVAWTALISGLVNNGEYEDSICWFIHMLRSSVRPNPLTLSSMLSASANLAMLNQGSQIHAHVIKLAVESDLSIQNSLVALYSKCGSVADAYNIFKSITTPNIVSFNAMITGFAQNGFGKEAVQLFMQVQNTGEEPNDVTFLGLLSACTHAGLVDDGWKYFKSMKILYNIDPGPDHYACMVDLLGRAGLLDEAMDLINSMSCEPHSGVWGALLGASRVQLRLDLAKLAAQSIFQLEPHNAAPYVVLSDIYSMAGKKKDEEELRLAKKLNGIRKNPGCSWFAEKDKVIMFLSGDRSHTSFDEIKIILWTIMDEMIQLHCTDSKWLPLQ